jgi:hypothetical protein
MDAHEDRPGFFLPPAAGARPMTALTTDRPYIAASRAQLPA